MIITTAGRTNEAMIAKARQIAIELRVKYVNRNKRAIMQIMESEQDDCIVVGQNRLEMYHLGRKEPFFFHPNSAMFRVKRLLKGERDPFVEATKLEAGMSFLDCTLGLASDSIVASYTVGSTGKVIGVEANPYLAYMVRQGLETWSSGLEKLDTAMRKISVVPRHSLYVMQAFQDNSVDCVYFDPMFEANIIESDGIKGLTHFASMEGLSEEMMSEALRIARKRVVLKDHYQSVRFEKFDFHVYTRKTAKFHFGVIEKT